MNGLKYGSRFRLYLTLPTLASSITSLIYVSLSPSISLYFYHIYPPSTYVDKPSEIITTSILLPLYLSLSLSLSLSLLNIAIVSPNVPYINQPGTTSYHLLVHHVLVLMFTCVNYEPDFWSIDIRLIMPIISPINPSLISNCNLKEI